MSVTHYTRPMGTPRKKPDLMRIGWKEWVNLPALGKVGVAWIKAKIDTGARTSALHAENLEVVIRREKEYARFTIHPKQRSNRRAVTVTVPIKEWRGVRSSNGQMERRPVIETKIRLGKHEWKGEITLSDRDQMGFRMLLGRTSLEGRFAVDCAAAFLGPEPMKRNKPSIIIGTKKAENGEATAALDTKPKKKLKRKKRASGAESQAVISLFGAEQTHSDQSPAKPSKRKIRAADGSAGVSRRNESIAANGEPKARPTKRSAARAVRLAFE